MSHPAQRIVEMLARYTTIPLDLIIFGGGAMALAFRQERTTEDLDILIQEKDLRIYAEQGFGEILDKVNGELETQGLYIRHLWSPAQEILCREWETHLIRINPFWNNHLLQLRSLGGIDLLASKLVRFDEVDQGDIRHLIGNKFVMKEELETLSDSLIIPTAFETEVNTIRRRASAVSNWA